MPASLRWNRTLAGDQSEMSTNEANLTTISTLLKYGYTTIDPTEVLTVDQSWHESYILENTTIQDTVLALQNTSVFIANTIIIDSKITTNANANTSYTIFIRNCTLVGSEVVIDSASNCTIESCHFVIQNVQENQQSNHMLRVSNTGFLFIFKTIFGPQGMGLFGTRNMKLTNLGLKIEHVLYAEIKTCTFSGIASEISDGSAMFLKTTEVVIISSKFYSNVAQNGVIFASNSVNITNINSSYISNYAVDLGGVFYLMDFCTLSNNACNFQNDSSEFGGAIYAKNRVLIKNRDTLFQYNSAKYGSVMRLTDNCQVMNKQVIGFEWY